MNVTVNYLYKRFITLLKKSNVHTRDSTLQSGQRAPHIRELIQAPALQLSSRQDPPTPGTACGQTEARLGKAGEMATGTQHHGERGLWNQAGATGPDEPLGQLRPPSPTCGPTSAACSRPVRQVETTVCPVASRKGWPPHWVSCTSSQNAPSPKAALPAEGTSPPSPRASEAACCLHWPPSTHSQC